MGLLGVANLKPHCHHRNYKLILDDYATRRGVRPVTNIHQPFEQQ
jgi:hypothetical protein